MWNLGYTLIRNLGTSVRSALSVERDWDRLRLFFVELPTTCWLSASIDIPSGTESSTAEHLRTCLIEAADLDQQQSLH